jgi:hypothetical protein
MAVGGSWEVKREDCTVAGLSSQQCSTLFSRTKGEGIKYCMIAQQFKATQATKSLQRRTAGPGMRIMYPIPDYVQK